MYTIIKNISEVCAGMHTIIRLTDGYNSYGQLFMVMRQIALGLKKSYGRQKNEITIQYYTQIINNN